MLGHRQAGIAGVPGQILTARKNNEAVRVRMSAWILLAKACARQWSFEDIAKIKNVITTRQHRVRNVLMHQTKPGAVVKVFAGRVCVSVKIMDQPRGREDPVLKAFVVITIL